MKKILIIIILVVLVGAIVLFGRNYLSRDYFGRDYLSEQKEQKVCLQEHCFLMEIAKTEAQREQGLMDRKEMAQNKGMLFIFEQKGLYSFWMKNTFLALDIIWLDGQGRTVFLSQNVLPCEQDPCPVISPDKIAKYVLELNTGQAQVIGLKVGDKWDLGI